MIIFEVILSEQMITSWTITVIVAMEKTDQHNKATSFNPSLDEFMTRWATTDKSILSLAAQITLKVQIEDKNIDK